jgi:arginine N-succinyltransferase
MGEVANMLLRPVSMGDLDALEALAGLTGFGLTTIPRDRAVLERRIRQSEHAFAKVDPHPGPEAYLFVMEDLSRQQVVGTCGVMSKTGGFEPFYAYRVEKAVRASQELNIRKVIPTLHLVTEHNGPCEIGSLFLHPQARGQHIGRLLSMMRFVYLAQFPAFFDQTVIAEMRGVIDEQGRSPFWDALGRHFFDIEFVKADYLSLVNKRFIADLMPRHPIYIPLLPESAQAVIGQVHDQTAPALHILQQEGFAFSGMVDIFEAGPVVLCELPAIRAVAESRLDAVASLTDDDPTDSPYLSIIATPDRNMRGCGGVVQRLEARSVAISKRCAEMLGLGVGDLVRHVKLRPDKPGDAGQDLTSVQAQAVSP